MQRVLTLTGNSREEIRRRVVAFRKSSSGRGGTSYDSIAQLGAARRALGDNLDEWRRELETSFPILAGDDPATSQYDGLYEEDLEDPDLPQDGPESQVLGLPSDLDWDGVNTDATLTQAALAELKLRTGHAYDLLASIRLALRKKGALLEEKEKHARGQKEHTRGQRKIKGVQDQAKFLADMYNRNLDRMRKIMPPALATDATAAIPPGLRVVDKTKDLTIPPTRQLHNTGDTKRQLPWIFQPAGVQSSAQDGGEEWEAECAKRASNLWRAGLTRGITGRRTDWFRAWAAKRRTDEEVNLLYADGRAVRRGFQFASGLWNAASEQADITAGAKAYAVQKSDMFRRMAEDVENSVASAQLEHSERFQESEDDDDDGLTNVFRLTQARQHPADDKLDYSLVSTMMTLAITSIINCFF